MANSRARTSAKRKAASVDLDTAAFTKALAAAVRRMELTCEQDLSRLGVKAQNEMRRLAPVDTGRLRASIIAVDGHDSRGPFVKIGTNVDYAPYVEYGTSRSPAQPFMRPGLLVAMRAFRSK